MAWISSAPVFAGSVAARRCATRHLGARATMALHAGVPAISTSIFSASVDRKRAVSR